LRLHPEIAATVKKITTMEELRMVV
jgi:hypothetical protein